MNQIEKVKLCLKKMYLKYGNQILAFTDEHTFDYYHEKTKIKIEMLQSAKKCYLFFGVDKLKLEFGYSGVLFDDYQYLAEKHSEIEAELLKDGYIELFDDYTKIYYLNYDYSKCSHIIFNHKLVEI